MKKKENSGETTGKTGSQSGQQNLLTDQMVFKACDQFKETTGRNPSLDTLAIELGVDTLAKKRRIWRVLRQWKISQGIAVRIKNANKPVTAEEFEAACDRLFASTGKPPYASAIAREMGVKVQQITHTVMAVLYPQWAQRHGIIDLPKGARKSLFEEKDIHAACDRFFEKNRTAPLVADVKRELNWKTSAIGPIDKAIRTWCTLRGIDRRLYAVSREQIHAVAQALYLQTGKRPLGNEVWEGLGKYGEKVRIRKFLDEWEPVKAEGPLVGYTIQQVDALIDSIYRDKRQIPTTAELQKVMAGGDVTRIKQIRDAWLRRHERKLLPAIDPEFEVFKTVDVRLTEWAALALGWFEQRGFDNEHTARGIRGYVGQFLFDYILLPEQPFSTEAFLRKSYIAPQISTFFPTNTPPNIRHKHGLYTELIEYILRRNHSIEVELGYADIDPRYHNPIPPLPAELLSTNSKKRTTRQKTGFRTVLKGSTNDQEFIWLTKVDPRFEQWRVFASEWIKTLSIALMPPMQALRQLFIDYMLASRLPLDPATFLRRGAIQAPNMYETAMTHLRKKADVRARFRFINDFIEYVLLNYFSAEDDDGARTILPEYRNPIPPLEQAVYDSLEGQNSESDKNVLPSMYVRNLREFLCPPEAHHFQDLKWAQSRTDRAKGSIGDWFIVDQNRIDRNDPDCVWRHRESTNYEQENGIAASVYEIWSPVRTIALLVKLELPLRTYQVRMLDSGEADTWRYEQGRWSLNKGHLVESGRREVRNGVFRRIKDTLTGNEFTGLFINTNKTQDRLKEASACGYEVPWSHQKVLYWLEKLRNWQEKYNPIARSTAWTDLEKRHITHVKTDAQLALLGNTCFLFRNPNAEPAHRDKPITVGVINVLWKKLLISLQKQVEEQGQRGLNGDKLLFVPPHSEGDTTYYPLHSLRVTLISHYALEGGVSMNILSKCIAGHARIVMTLYYTKAGVTYVSEMMDGAGKKILDAEQRNYITWLKDATLKQLENNTATVHVAAIGALKNAFDTHNGLVKYDKGMCPKGGMGCPDGGIQINEETGSITYTEVPGYPSERNCVRCRWFITGPAFLLGLHDHWNKLHLALGDSGERYKDLETQVEKLEEEQYSCEVTGELFTQIDKLASLQKAHAEAFELNEKLLADSLATLRLIARCQALIHDANVSGSDVDLVAAGGMKEIKIVMEDCSELQQVLTVAASASIFVEDDSTKAVLKAGRAFDMMLHRNNKHPVFFKPAEKELPIVVHHMTRLLQAQAGSIRDAVPFIDGIKPLKELGFDMDGEELLDIACAGKRLGWTGKEKMLERSRIVQLPTSTADEELL